MAEVKKFNGTGRRKFAVVRACLVTGKGDIAVKKVGSKKTIPFTEYFTPSEQLVAMQALKLTKLDGAYNITLTVFGGGKNGQAGAVNHAITNALLVADPELRKVLKKAGFITRDPRMKERKKYGLKAARRAPQFSKR